MVFLFFFVFALACPQISHAYIDPGTGGMVVSSFSIIGIILVSAFSFILAYFLKPLWKFILRPIWNLLKIIASKIGASRKISVVAVILAVSVAALAYQNYFSKKFMSATSGNTKKVIVLGIDGFDPDIIEFLMKEGKLPNFEKLKSLGAAARMDTAEPPISPVVWTTMATGVNPGKHNIFDFMWFDRQKYLPYLSVLDQDNSFLGMKYIQPVKASSFWENISKENVPVSVIHWPVTFPPQKISGNNLSGLGTPDVKGFMNGYARYTDRATSAGKYGTDSVILVKVSAGQVQSDLQGPMKSSGESVTVPFVLNIIDSGNAELTVQDKEYNLKKGEWSDWITVRFKQSFGRSLSAIFKIYSQEFSPGFDMFATSMQFDPQAPTFPISAPGEYSAKLAGEIGNFYTLGMPEDAKAVNDSNLSQKAFMGQVDEIRTEREKMFWSEYKKLLAEKSGVLAVVFDETDRAEHILLGDEVSFKDSQIQSVGADLEKIYTDKDKMIGEVLDTLPADTSLMVVSDHAFKPFKRAVNLNNWLLDNGYLVLKDGFSADNAGALFKNVDWSKTRAYSYGYVSVNLNLAGREKSGIVPAGEKDDLENEIIAKLKNFSDPPDGRNIISNVYKGSEIYSGPNAGNGADLVVGFNVPYRIDWESPVGGFSQAAVFENDRPWQADHIFDAPAVPGIFFSNFKISQNPGVLDIAPTVLDFMGIKKPSDYEGKSLLKK